VKEFIRQRALELGFDACRFASAEPPASFPQFERWLRDGCHGAMAYLERGAAKRADPSRILPDVRTVIVLAAAHTPAPGDSRIDSTREGPEGAGTTLGLVARYARHNDYHEVLAGPLKALSLVVNSAGGPGTRSLAYTDTGPILERDLAQRAGIGFIGKHTGLIRPDAGNWFLLAEILTTLEIEPDDPQRNRCGTCVRCIQACPTGAITGPFRLDARRCISYLTIEWRGSIPVDLRPAIGSRIFGCDDCLAVCPWNRFAREGALMKAAHRPELDGPDLLELLDLSEALFRERYRRTPLWRARRSGLLRNVCVALGNSGDWRALPALDRATRDPDPLIAEHAAWARDQITSRSVPR
jgi:epoxyqueuosine reductase